MTMQVKDHTADVVNTFAALTRKEVLVGFHGELSERDGSPINNAALGYIHNYGTGNIPARPFMEPGVDAVRDECVEDMRAIATGALGKMNAVGILETGLEKIGLRLEMSVKAQINAGLKPDLADSTKAARDRKARKSYGKKARGNNKSAGKYTPLVDTGKMRESITHVVRPREG